MISLGISFVFPLILIPCFAQLNLLGIWLNFPITSLLTGLLCIFLIYIYVYRRKILSDQSDKTSEASTSEENPTIDNLN